VSSRVDYDAIAHLYDDRRRDYAADPRLSGFLAERRLSAADVRVLDVGCGTGKQLAANRARYSEMRLTGVDLSAGMLRIARARESTVAWVQGDARALPCVSERFDYVTNQFSYPHIADKRRFAAEVFRVLRPGGRFVLTNIDPWAMAGWVLYRYFPEARALDERDFLSREALTALLSSAGFSRIATTATDRSQPQDLAALLSSVRQRHSASQLIAITDAAYRAGVQRVCDDLEHGGRTVDSPFVVITLEADKPS